MPTPDPIARQTTLIAWMLASASNGLTTWQIAQQWQRNPGTVAILNRLHRLQRLGLVEAVERVESKLYRLRRG